jgi:hypothetical protein
MRYNHSSFALTRNITLKGVPMDVVFYYYPPYEATQYEPGFEGEIEIDSIWIDEFDVINLFGDSSIEDVESELWKILKEGEDV